jgi:diguanylate cyclase (GGDEF)-like protein
VTGIGPRARRTAPPYTGLDGQARIPAAWSYALVGVLLGVGAPVGAFVIRVLEGLPDISAELSEHGFFYMYELFASCFVFGLAGWFVGRRADRYRAGRDLYRDLAEHDPLTGLANARAFLEHRRRAAEHAERYGEPLSLLLVDVDRLKDVNDSLGHAAGHAALIHVANALRRCKREDDIAARWGGDEFAILMRGADESAARRQADAILAELRSRPLRFEGAQRTIGVTIGAATASGGSADALFQRADQALYAGKAAGRGLAVCDAEPLARPAP